MRNRDDPALNFPDGELYLDMTRESDLALIELRRTIRAHGPGEKSNELIKRIRSLMILLRSSQKNDQTGVHAPRKARGRRKGKDRIARGCEIISFPNH